MDQKKTGGKIVSEYRQFVRDCQHLIFSLPGEQDYCELSYSPFVMSDKPLLFYVVVSALASASRALIAASSEQQRVSLLFVDGSERIAEPFARKRLLVRAQPIEIQRSDSQWDRKISAFKDRFGETILTLVQLQDFHMIALKPLEGRFIKGFGQAFDLSGDELTQWEHLRSS